MKLSGVSSITDCVFSRGVYAEIEGSLETFESGVIGKI